MAPAFPISNPKEFLEEFVRRPYKEFEAAPLEPFWAKTTIHGMNVMAERVWDALNKTNPARVGNAKSAGEYRRYLVASECPDFQLVWDVDDAHKHVSLGRASAAVSSASQSGVRRRGGAVGSAAIGETAIGGTADEFVIVLNDGSERRVKDVLRNVMKMWDRLLS